MTRCFLLLILGALLLPATPGAGSAQRLQEPPVQTAEVADSSLVECPTCIGKRVDVAVLEVVFINLLAITLNRYWYGAGVDPSTWKANIERGLEFDNNQFRANYIEHPYAGSGYYNAGRSNKMNFWESVPLTFGGSLMFEYFGESHPPSANDLITTTLGGITLGEALYRLSSLVLDNQATGADRVLREIGATLINPVRGINRLLFGRMGAVGPNYFERHPSFLAMQLTGGARRIADGTSLDNGTTDAFVEFDVRYADPFEQTLRKPFEAFEFAVQISNGTETTIDRLNIRGSLYGVDIRQGPGSRHKMVVSLEHDFNLNQEYQYGQNSVNGGLLSDWPLAQTWSVRTDAVLEAIPFGAVNTTQKVGRGYDFGVGAGALLKARLLHRRRSLVEVGYKGVWLHTIDGVNDSHTLQFWTARVALPLVGRFGLGADGVLFLRESQGASLPGGSQRSPQLRLYGSWGLE